MRLARAGITNGLISEESIKQKLPTIFVDSLIVDQKFNIIVVSQNVLEFLEFTAEELSGKSLNYLTREDIALSLSGALQDGSFDEVRFDFFSKTNKGISVGVSGFYLGLISDINGYIVLKVRNLSEVEVINSQLQLKKAELDQFIYRASHDLRGPLATMKGLLNLLKIRPDNDEVDRLLSLLDAHANKLDERLFQLMALAHADQIDPEPSNVVVFAVVETELRKIAEQNAFLDSMALHFSSSEAELHGLNELLVTALLNNLFLYLLSLPTPSLTRQVFFRMEPNAEGLSVVVEATGFEVNERLREAINGPNSIYTDLINFPKLVNFYAAQKIAWKLKASIKVQIMSTEDHRIIVSVPFLSNHL